MKALTRTVLATAFAAFSLATVAAGPAHADPDTDFANELHTYGIYGPKDYNAWIGKIECKRLHTGVDPNAAAAAGFLKTNLPRARPSSRSTSSSPRASTTTAPKNGPWWTASRVSRR
jgi:hypothetical protein